MFVRGKTALILIIVLVFFLGVFAALYFSGAPLPFTASKATVSGKFDINGVIPAGATITLTAKELGTQGATAQVVASGLAVADLSSWSFDTAQKGKTYEIQAQVVVNGSTVATSSPIEVTAPADDESLSLNLVAENTGKKAVVSGNIEVNGYVPSGSTIVVKGRKLGSELFETVASGLPGQQSQFMSYSTAVAGTTYEVEGILLSSSGKTLGTSNILTVTAPAVNETLTINSSATAPAAQPTSAPAGNGGSSQQSGSSNISGSINFNGAAPANSRIVVFASPANTNNNQVVVNNISPTDGTTWTWNSAQNATWYTLFAVLKQAQPNGTDKDISTSSPITVAAPASSVVFTINSGMSLTPPGGPITVNCQQYNSGPNQNNWNVTVSFQSVPGAQSYWYQVGSTNGGNNLTNNTQNSQTGSAQTVGLTFNDNTTYYARYAYSNIANQSAGSNQYSGFSNTTPLQCSN